MPSRARKENKERLDARAILASLASLRTPIIPIKVKTIDKGEWKAVQDTISAQGPPVRLRNYLATKTNPPPELLDAQQISDAIPLSDCWKYADRLSVEVKEVVIDTSELLRATQILMRGQPRADIRRWARGLLLIASKTWKKHQKHKIAPTEATAVEFLTIANTLVEYGVPSQVWATGRKISPQQILPELVVTSLELVELYPSVRNAVLGADIVSSAIVRHSLDTDTLASATTDIDPIARLWALLKAELTSALRAIRLSDARSLLKSMAKFPSKTREFARLIDEYLVDSRELDKACRSLLLEYTDSDSSDAADPEFLSESQQGVEITEFARIMLKVWDVSERLLPYDELSQELITTLDRLYGLRFIGNVGHTTRYSPAIHEFEPGASVSDSVQVIRPGVQIVSANKTSVVFKAIVRVEKES